MQTNLYSMFDQKTKFFHAPIYLTNDAEAIRNFSMVVNDSKGKNPVNLFPEDYDLYHLGTFDDITGYITPLKSPQHVIKAIQLKEAAPQPQVQQ